MIGNFAKMFAPKETVTEVAQTEAAYEIGARESSGIERRTTTTDAPPANFSEKMPYEGGDVYVVPFVDALRAWLAKRK